MLVAEWQAGTGWSTPEIKPFGNLSLSPSCTVFHYATECFEGMKAYKDSKGNVRLFRPDLNVDRLLKSTKRLTLPAFPKDEMLAAIKQLVKVEQDWIPSEKGYSLYIRPTMIATQPSLGVGASNRALFFCILSPVGPYYKTGFNAVSLLATEKYVRAWPGGTGDAKIGANYAPGILPQIEAAKQGYQQNLWLFNDHITEVGTMNCFVYWKNREGKKELATPPLDGTILPGVTRQSTIELVRSFSASEGITVVERPITVKEIIDAQSEKRLLEIFGTGTACIVSPVKKIRYKNKDIQIPLDPKDPNSQAGPLAKRIVEEIMKIQYGEIPNHPWSVVL